MKHKQGIRWGEVAQRLQALASLVKDPNLVPSTHTVALDYLSLLFQGIWCPLLSSTGTRRKHSKQTHKAKTFIKHKVQN